MSPKLKLSFNILATLTVIIGMSLWFVSLYENSPSYYELYSRYKTDFIVTEIKNRKEIYKGFCIYKITPTAHYKLNTPSEGWIIDTISAFNIGDTVKFSSIHKK